jgi:hypothetical protein
MSVNLITNTSYSKGTENGYQLNARVYNLQADGYISSSAPGVCISKSIINTNGITGTYIIPEAKYEDFSFSYNNNSIPLASDGSFDLDAGVYLIAVNMTLTSVGSDVELDLINYDSAVIYSGAKRSITNSDPDTISFTYILNLPSQANIALRLIVSASTNIVGNIRESSFSIYKLP